MGIVLIVSRETFRPSRPYVRPRQVADEATRARTRPRARAAARPTGGLPRLRGGVYMYYRFQGYSLFWWVSLWVVGWCLCVVDVLILWHG